MTANNIVKKIVIAGGGTAGWMVAAALSRHFRKTEIKIQLVESSQIGTIGVGEATIPTLRRFYRELGMADREIIGATQATVKLGIEFRGWSGEGCSFIHPFGVFGQSTHGIPFHNFWLKLRNTGDRSELADYCLGIALARAGKFAPPADHPRSALSVFDWALHFDASRFSMLLRDYAERCGVERVDGKIAQVELDRHSGFIGGLVLDGGRKLRADLYIDCTGFQALLIEGGLQTGYEDWSHWLLCDSAVAAQSERCGEPLPYTVATARSAGWQWRIPLQRRQGNGHVYCREFMSREAAEERLIEHIDGELLQPPRHFSFSAGRRRLAWNKNCIAVGLAAGFLEPLESTSIALIETAIEKIRGSFSHPCYNQKIVDRFNRVTALEYERIRDFIILHYKANRREDGEFWHYCREMSVPDTLEEKMVAYREQGQLIRSPWEIFHPDSWLAVYSGLGLYPQRYDRRVDAFGDGYIRDNLRQMREVIAGAVERVPSHGEFLRNLGNMVE